MRELSGACEGWNVTLFNLVGPHDGSGATDGLDEGRSHKEIYRRHAERLCPDIMKFLAALNASGQLRAVPAIRLPAPAFLRIMASAL